MSTSNGNSHLSPPTSPVPLPSSAPPPPGGKYPAWVYILFWCSAGYVMVMFNKALLSNWHFGFPFFLTFCHSLFATIMTQVMWFLCPDWLPGVKSNQISFNDYLVKIFPISLLFSGALVFGNSAYKYISVAYLQIMKSMTPVPTLLVSFLIGREKPTWTQLIIVLVICAGIITASVGELSFSWIGFGLQVSAMVCDITRTVVLDILLVNTRLDPISTLYYMAPASAVLIGVGFMIFEYKHFDSSRLTTEFSMVLMLNACTAFILNISVVLLLGNTSPVIVSVCGVMKDIVLVVSSIVVFGSQLAPSQVAGYSVSIVGLNFYKNYKQNPKLFKEYCRRLIHKTKLTFCCCFGYGLCAAAEEYKDAATQDAYCCHDNPLTLLIFLLNGASMMAAEQQQQTDIVAPTPQYASDSNIKSNLTPRRSVDIEMALALHNRAAHSHDHAEEENDVTDEKAKLLV